MNRFEPDCRRLGQGLDFFFGNFAVMLSDAQFMQFEVLELRDTRQHTRQDFS